MAIKISLSLWLVVLVIVTQVQGISWPRAELDVGNYPDTDTTQLQFDLNHGLGTDTTGTSGWTVHPGHLPIVCF